MFTGNKFTVSVLSALTLAILTACGGSSEEFDIEGNKWLGGKERAVKERRKHAELPAVNNPAPTSFLDDPKKTGNSTSDNNTDKKVSPKQVGNVVTVVDHGYNQGYKTIKFNQPGMIDYLCVGGTPDGVCASKNATNAENNKAEIAKKEKELTEAEKLVSDKEMELTSAYKKNPNMSDDEIKKLIDNDLDMKALRDKVKNVKDKIEELKGEQTKLEQNAKNEVFFFKPDGERVEENNYRNSYSKEKDIEDAGIVPVAGFYDKNGDLRVQKGMVGREFDGIIVLEDEKDKDGKVKQRSYLRDPVAAGWSYNTFGVFQEKRGNSDVRGYQSIGIKTPTSALERENADKDSEANKRYMEKYLPYYGRATYTGIGHAYHNDEQVTMNVKVDADFHDRHLNFETSNATAHTFEKEGHLTRVRPDLDLKGAADWAADVADFRGKVHNVGGNLEGQLEGSFYGPNAAEVGGVYGLHGKDKEGKPVNYVGGFGAKRP